MPSRIAYILSSDSIGGGNRSLQSLWSALNGREFSPVAFSPGDGAIANACRARHVECEVVPFIQPSIRTLVTTFRSRQAWMQLFLKNNIELIHANDVHSARCISMAAAALRIPVVCHIRFDVPPETIKWSFRGLTKPAAFIFNSHAMQSEVGELLASSCPDSRQVVVHNGVNVEEFARRKLRSGEKPRVAMVANLIPFKGHADFLEMARRLADRGLNLEFWLAGGTIGNPNYGEMLNVRARELGLARDVSFLGFCDHVPELLNEIDVLVSASHYEPFGRSVAEAMACEIPVVATAVGGVVEVVVDGETGFLVPPHRPEPMADRVELLLRDSELRGRMGRAARARIVQDFNAKDHARKVTDLYRQLIPMRTAERVASEC